MSLPDRKRARLVPPARALAASLARLAVEAAWRARNPAARERFVEADAPGPLSRLYYEARDGWRAPLFVVPPAPGGAGEPVVVAHALGLRGDAYRYGAASLSCALSDAGFAVYLLAHRGDASAYAPDGRAGLSFDDVVDHDLPAALARACEHAGYPRAHFVGHGLGGQLGLAWAGRSGGHRLASLVALCAAVRFDAPRSEARRAARLLGMLPAHWRVPSRTVARWLTPWFDDDVGGAVTPGASPPARVRGILQHAVDDVPVALLAQMQRWLDAGSLTDASGLYDHLDALSGALVPLLVGVSPGDRVCPPEAAAPALERWGHTDRTLLTLPDAYGHLDPLLAHDAPERVFGPVTAWLDARRRLAWERDGEAPRAVSA